MSVSLVKCYRNHLFQPIKETMAYQEIEGFADLELEVEAHLDQTHMTLRQILELAPDTTIKLNRPAGENIDLLVGGNVLCSGEIVIVNEMLSVRITDFREER